MTLLDMLWNGAGIMTLTIDGVDYRCMRRLPDEWHSAFWNQGINMDDYDYAVICSDLGRAKVVEKLLSGCSDNEVRIFNIHGQNFLVGMAYHG